MATDKQAADIFEMLTKQSFADFYEGDLVPYNKAAPDALSRLEILAEIKNLIR